MSHAKCVVGIGFMVTPEKLLRNSERYSCVHPRPSEQKHIYFGFPMSKRTEPINKFTFKSNQWGAVSMVTMAVSRSKRD